MDWKPLCSINIWVSTQPYLYSILIRVSLPCRDSNHNLQLTSLACNNWAVLTGLYSIRLYTFWYKSINCLKGWSRWEKAVSLPDIEHDEANDIVVQSKSSLLWQLGNESDQSSQSLENWNCIFSRQLLHEVFEEQVAVLNQASPDHLSSKK